MLGAKCFRNLALGRENNLFEMSPLLVYNGVVQWPHTTHKSVMPVNICVILKEARVSLSSEILSLRST